MKITRAFFASGIFLFLVIGFYLVHMKYFQVDVVFYSAIFDGILAAIVTTAIIWKLQYFKHFNNFEKFQLSVIWLLTGYALAISVPTVLDRSLSFYILEKIEQRGGGIRLDTFEAVFTEEYAAEHRLADVRLTEQLESGTIIIDNGCVKITALGENLASFSRFFRQNFLPKKRLLMGKYTDALTDPFREERKDITYRCD